MESFTAFGELLHYLRRRAGLTLKELGEQVGYSESQIARLESGQIREASRSEEPGDPRPAELRGTRAPCGVGDVLSEDWPGRLRSWHGPILACCLGPSVAPDRPFR